VRDEGGLAGGLDLARLHAVVVGVEHEGAARCSRRLDGLEQHHARVRHAGGVDGRERDGVGVVDLLRLGLGEPGSRDGEGILAREYPAPFAHRRLLPASRAEPSARRGEGNAGREGVANGDGVEIGPTALAIAEWRAAGLALPDLPAMRRWRLDRLVAQVVAAEVGGLLMFDPLNIRYATDSTNMQLWNAHNPFRACLVLPDGHMVLWDYKNAPFLAAHNPLVAEVRSGASFFYSVTGDRTAEAAAAFAPEIAELMRAHAPGLGRLAVDKIMLAGLRALEAAGLAVEEGEPLTERARAIKSPDEVAAMRCALHACETAMAAMHAAARPGLSEDEVWAVLHAENIRRGGEWIETRLLASGPRTNPWFQECGPRVPRPDEVLAFDTDMIGPYGACADISRTWWIGDGPIPAEVAGDTGMAGLMAGKRGLIMGVANDKSIAWGIAQACRRAGCRRSPSPTRAKRSASGSSRSPPPSAPTSCCPATSTDEASLDAVFAEVAERWGKLDFLVHAIGFSDKNELRGRYVDTPRRELRPDHARLGLFLHRRRPARREADGRRRPRC
jgi:hypothetical protein